MYEIIVLIIKLFGVFSISLSFILTPVVSCVMIFLLLERTYSQTIQEGIMRLSHYLFSGEFGVLHFHSLFPEK